jgi:predicted acylesterase/phospholipase RssA
MRALAIALIVVLSAAVTAQEPACLGCVEARYWQVDPGYWSSAAPNLDAFPERQLDPPLPGADLAVAFSGGGTRSASASIGQLRGLLQNGWIDRVKYVTGVSGGSWAAVPFTYYPGERLSDLLGTFDADLKKIDLVDFEKRPNGSLALQVTKSGLAASGVEEAFQFLPDQKQGEIDLARIRSVGTMLRDGIRKVRGRDLPDASRQNKTYAHILGQIFIDPLVKDGNRMPYGWTRNAVLDITEVSHQPQMDFQQVPDKRPFLIVGGTIVWMRPGFVYPRLIPIEYTPLYTGVRQQFGNLGGTYVMPWAYDREHVLVSGDRLLVDPAKVRMFTLADMIGSSGAAPQLKLMLGESLPERARGPAMQAAGAFPSFRPFAIRDGQFVAPAGELAHGDGGFTDNLGLMPLLARQVRHVIAFVNSNKTYTQNEQLQSYFFPLSTQSGSGDKTMNAVFPKAKYRELLDGLDEVTKAGGPAIFCQTMTVTRNELYNIAGYDGLRVCWVYNHAANHWREALPDQLKTWLGDPKNGGRKDLQRFPYYATFEENKPYVIKLNALQVNLLANLAAWSITSEEGKARILDAFGPAVFPATTGPR